MLGLFTRVLVAYGLIAFISEICSEVGRRWETLSVEEAEEVLAKAKARKAEEERKEEESRREKIESMVQAAKEANANARKEETATA